MAKTTSKKRLSNKKSTKIAEEPIKTIEYLTRDQIEKGLTTLKKYTKKRAESLGKEKGKPKDLLEADNDDPTALSRVIVEVVFKNVPSNSKTYIHSVHLPYHWRMTLAPESQNIALFVPHRRAENEAQAIQFAKDRDLDIDNTHTYYQDLFDENLDESLRSKISRIITTKELATEFSTPQKLDRLAKTYDFFLSDKKLMSNKMNPLPRRLGRRFWVREKKVPLMVRLEAKNLSERFQRAICTEPFYVVGRSSTERIQVGLLSQHTEHLAENVQVFLKKLHDLYGDCVRFIKFRSNHGLSLPIFADLSLECPKVEMKRRRVKPKPVVDEFDFFDEDDVKISVKPSGAVKVIHPGKCELDSKKSKRKAQESPADEKRKKKKMNS